MLLTKEKIIPYFSIFPINEEFFKSSIKCEGKY